MTTPQLDDDTIAFANKVFEAVRMGDTQTLEPWLQQGLPVNICNQNGDSLLMLASYHGHLDTVKALLEHGADTDLINARGQSPLAGVAFKGYADIVRVLLDHGAKVDIHSEDGRTPLMFAAMFNHTDIMEILLRDGGADVKHVDTAGNSVWDCAKAMNASEAMAWLELYFAGKDQDFFELS